MEVEIDLDSMPPEPGVLSRPEQELREAFLREVERIPGGCSCI